MMRKLKVLAMVCALLTVLSGCSAIPVLIEKISPAVSTVPEIRVPENTETPADTDVPESTEAPADTDVPESTEAPAEESSAPAAPDTNEPTVLEALQEEIRAQGKLFGVAYLGGFEGEAPDARAELLGQAYLENLAFVRDIEDYVVQDGWQMYCVVPADDSVSLSVCSYVFADVPYAGEELLFTNKPVLLRGNVSDIVPNLCIIATRGGERVEYCPMQSGMDNTLVNGEQTIYDFTPYDAMPEFEGLAPMPD